MNFIQQLVKGETSDVAHQQFIRYSVGNYENKALVLISNGPTFKIQTSFEFATDLIKLLANNLDEELEVKGVIFSKTKLPDSIKKKGFFLIDVDETMTIDALQTIVNERKLDSYILLNIIPYLKVKQKLVKPGKSKPDGKYCTLSFKGNDKLRKIILDEFVFDAKQDFKKMAIDHTFVVDDIEIPKEFENDLEQARIHAKRTGSIKRTIDADGVKTTTTHKFNA